MSELAAFLADHELDHVAAALTDAGITRVDELRGLAADLSVLGLDDSSIAQITAALGRPSQAAPKFSWQRSAGDLLAGTFAGGELPLPPPPRPPLARSVSSFSATLGGPTAGGDAAPPADPLTGTRAAAGASAQSGVGAGGLGAAGGRAGGGFSTATASAHS